MALLHDGVMVTAPASSSSAESDSQSGVGRTQRDPPAARSSAPSRVASRGPLTGATPRTSRGPGPAHGPPVTARSQQGHGAATNKGTKLEADTATTLTRPRASSSDSAAPPPPADAGPSAAPPSPVRKAASSSEAESRLWAQTPDGPSTTAEGAAARAGSGGGGFRSFPPGARVFPRFPLGMPLSSTPLQWMRPPMSAPLDRAVYYCEEVRFEPRPSSLIQALLRSSLH